jgi:hypothetical protein
MSERWAISEGAGEQKISAGSANAGRSETLSPHIPCRGLGRGREYATWTRMISSSGQARQGSEQTPALFSARAMCPGFRDRYWQCCESLYRAAIVLTHHANWLRDLCF